MSGRFRYAVDTRQRQSRGRLDAVMGASELAGWQVDSAGVTVTFPGAGPDSFRVRASRRGGSFELAGTTTPGGWRAEYSASGLPLEEWPDGRASGLRGRLGHAAGGVEGRSKFGPTAQPASSHASNTAPICARNTAGSRIWELWLMLT